MSPRNVNAFETFRTPYQASVDQPQPLFRRRAAPKDDDDQHQPQRRPARLDRRGPPRPKALLAEIVRDFSPVTFANSLGAEDMVLTDLIVKEKLPIEIFSLDTGRLPPKPTT